MRGCRSSSTITEKLAKQHKDGTQDDKSARELTNMLPEAFVWKVVSDDGERVKLRV